MADDILLNKTATIERCLRRIEEEYRGHEHELETNFTRQDAIILNLLRACEASIDVAMHIVRVRKLGLPQETREAFRLLQESGVLTQTLSDQMQRMVGFRNIAVHDYTKLSLPIVRAIVERQLDDFRHYARSALAQA